MKTTKVVLILHDDSVIMFNSKQRGKLALFDAGHSLDVDPIDIKAYVTLPYYDYILKRDNPEEEMLGMVDVFLWGHGLKNLHLS